MFDSLLLRLNAILAQIHFLFHVQSVIIVFCLGAKGSIILSQWQNFGTIRWSVTKPRSMLHVNH